MIEVVRQAMLYVESGLSVVPVRCDGTKKAAVEWKVYQSRLPAMEELVGWFEGHEHGIAIVAGAVSGNLEVLDIDAPHLLERIWERLHESVPALLRAARVRTPASGGHIAYRCESRPAGNQKLAERLVSDPSQKSGNRRDVLIETRAEGGYVIAPGSPASCHETGRPYVLTAGTFESLPVLTDLEREAVHEVARSFDQLPKVESRPIEAKPAGENVGGRPGDEFAAKVEWAEILEPRGWALAYESKGVSHWRRPGKTDDGTSATTNYAGSDLFYVFSSNADPFEDGKSYSKFAAYAVLEHGGDFSRAAKVLASEGDGRQAARSSASSGDGTTDRMAGVDARPEPSWQATRVDTVRAEPTEWLWPGRVPRGKLTILDGDPGLGKSTLTLEFAARITTGRPLGPGGDAVEQADVIVLSAEDGIADTIRPRLEAAGADLARCYVITTLPTLDGGDALPEIPRDLPIIRGEIERTGAALVVIDPLVVYVPADKSTHRDQHMRGVLAPLAQMAEETSVAIIAIRHLRKAADGNPIYRGGGTIGIIGAARVGLVVAKDPDDGDKRVLAVSKCNLAREATSLSFRLVEATVETEIGPASVGRIEWLGESSQTARSILAEPENDADRTALADACDVLKQVLADGPKDSKLARSEARTAGFSDRTLDRAKTRLGVKAIKRGFAGGWEWFLSNEPERREEF